MAFGVEHSAVDWCTQPGIPRFDFYAASRCESAKLAEVLEARREGLERIVK